MGEKTTRERPILEEKMGRSTITLVATVFYIIISGFIIFQFFLFLNPAILHPTVPANNATLNNKAIINNVIMFIWNNSFWIIGVIVSTFGFALAMEYFKEYRKLKE